MEMMLLHKKGFGGRLKELVIAKTIPEPYSQAQEKHSIEVCAITNTRSLPGQDFLARIVSAKIAKLCCVATSRP